MKINLQDMIFMASLMSITSIIMFREKMLMALLSLESAILCITLLVSFSNSNFMYYITTPIMVLTFGACEAAIGLSVLVLMLRLKGNDMMKAINPSKC